MDEDASRTIKLYKQQVTKKLSLADIQVNLLNDYLAGDYFNDKFKKEFEVPAVGEPISLDLGFVGLRLYDCIVARSKAFSRLNPFAFSLILNKTLYFF